MVDIEPNDDEQQPRQCFQQKIHFTAQSLHKTNRTKLWICELFCAI